MSIKYVYNKWWKSLLSVTIFEDFFFVLQNKRKKKTWSCMLIFNNEIIYGGINKLLWPNIWKVRLVATDSVTYHEKVWGGGVQNGKFPREVFYSRSLNVCYQCEARAGRCLLIKKEIIKIHQHLRNITQHKHKLSFRQPYLNIKYLI